MVMSTDMCDFVWTSICQKEMSQFNEESLSCGHLTVTAGCILITCLSHQPGPGSRPHGKASVNADFSCVRVH